MRDRVGPYRLVRRLGRGGMGEVWLAHWERASGLGKVVALKLVVLDARTSTAAFMREAQLSLLLAHSNIVTVFDAGIDGELGHLAMEWVDGIDLAHLLAIEQGDGRRGLREPIATFVVAQICRGLAYAHGLHHQQKPLHIVHRDISASNVLISREGEVKITDFGIARSLLAATSGAAVKGKLRYMAPEQFAARSVDARADLYAVGVTLHEMLAGTPLRHGESAAEIVAEIATADVPALAQLVSPALDDLRRWLLATDPVQRPATASDVLGYMQRHGLDRDATRELAELCVGATGGGRPISAPHSAGSSDATQAGVTTEAVAVFATTRTSPGSPVTSSDNRGPHSRPGRRRWWIGALALVGVAATGIVIAASAARERAAQHEVPLDSSVAAAPGGVLQPDDGGQFSPSPSATQDSPPVSADGTSPPPSTGVDSCPIDRDRDGVYDVLARWSVNGAPTRFAIYDGPTGIIVDTFDRHAPSSVDMICLGETSFALKWPDQLELWSTNDVAAPRRTLPARAGSTGVARIGDACISIEYGYRNVVDLDAHTFVDAGPCRGVDEAARFGRFSADSLPRFAARNAAVLRSDDGGELEVEAFAPMQWRRPVGLVADPRNEVSFAITARRIWIIGRVRNTDEQHLIGLDRADGRTIVERSATYAAAFRYFVADDVQLLHGTGAGVCSLDPAEATPRWCLGIWREE